MSSWAARAKAHFTKIPSGSTAETDETPLSSVLSVPLNSVYEELQPLSSVLSGRAVAVNGNFARPDSTAERSAWRFHYADRDPLEAHFWPPVTHHEALASEPQAVAAEPVPERTSTHSASSGIEQAELLALVAAVYVDDTDADRQEAINAALADPEGALTCYRLIAAERGIVAGVQKASLPAQQHTGCLTCKHLAKPGLSSGYCGSDRPDLEPAYGINHPLRRLPEDGGANCSSHTIVRWAEHYEGASQ